MAALNLKQDGLLTAIFPTACEWIVNVINGAQEKQTMNSLEDVDV